MSAAILPLAPGLLSTTTGWPTSLVSGSARVRAIRSGVEPAEKPTTMRSGLEGQAGWAKEERAATHDVRVAAAELRKRRLSIMAPSIAIGCAGLKASPTLSQRPILGVFAWLKRKCP